MSETQMRANGPNDCPENTKGISAAGPAGKFTPFITLLDETLRRKNAAYGDSASQAPMFAPNVSPEESVWVRLGDKVARLETLLRGGPDNGESIDDTLLDLAGYAAILWTLRRPGGIPTNEDGSHSPVGLIPPDDFPRYEVTCRY
ncbi:MAG: hypothetical protein IKE64_12490 [Thermoguttaceae bacterium]|nr:hypothetical protein [Thermoguttaceae bacterium]